MSTRGTVPRVQRGRLGVMARPPFTPCCRCRRTQRGGDLGPIARRHFILSTWPMKFAARTDAPCEAAIGSRAADTRWMASAGWSSTTRARQKRLSLHATNRATAKHAALEQHVACNVPIRHFDIVLYTPMQVHRPPAHVAPAAHARRTTGLHTARLLVVGAMSVSLDAIIHSLTHPTTTSTHAWPARCCATATWVVFF